MSKTNSVEQRKLCESEQRRKDIIKAVRALIKTGGAREITLRRVAEKAGFSTTVVYNLFQNKATLITQAMDSDLLDLVKAMRNAVDAKLPQLENIRRVGRAYVTFGMRHPDQYALVFMERRPHAPVESSRVEHGNLTQDPYAFACQLFVDLAATRRALAVILHETRVQELPPGLVRPVSVPQLEDFRSRWTDQLALETFS